MERGALGISQPAISRHLKVLENAGWVTVERDDTRRLRHFNPEPLAGARAWLDRYREVWEANYRRLDAVLADEG